MKATEAIISRRTIHTFSNEEVPREIIERSIDAANHAPCHRMTFPWRFTNLGKKQRELLFHLQVQIKLGGKSMEGQKVEKIRNKILTPSHLLVASQVSTNNELQKLEDYAACACAIQNLSLSLVSEGVGSKWSTGRLTTESKTYEIVGINPTEEEIIGFIWIGYGDPPPPIARPSITSIFREKS